MNRLELYNKLISKYGDKQVVVAIEELSELQKELCKHLRGKLDGCNLVEEIADVQIMLEQMILLFDIDQSTIDYVINQKLKRTEERLVKSEC